MTEGDFVAAVPRYGRVEAATRAQLREAGVSVRTSGVAATAVALARTLDGEPGARDAAAVARELRGHLADLTKDAAPKTTSSLDELRKRRDARRGAG